MVLALSLLIGTGISWVIVGVAVGWVGRKGYNLSFYQIISAVFSFSAGLIIAYLNNGSFLPPSTMAGKTAVIAASGCFVNGLFNYIMIRFMGRAMLHGPNAIVWAIIQSGLIYPFLMAWLVFGNQMTICRLVGIVLIVASIILYALRDGVTKNSTGKSLSAWLVPSILGMLCCGINQCGGNLPSLIEGGQELPKILRQILVTSGILVGCIGHFIYNIATGNAPAKPKKGEMIRLLGMSALVFSIGFTTSVYMQFPGLDKIVTLGRGAMGYPIMVAACIIGFFPYGTLVLKERVRPLQAIGAVVGVLGIVLGCF